MFRGVLLQLSRTGRDVAGVRRSTGRFLKYDLCTYSSLSAPTFPVQSTAAPMIAGSKVKRDFSICSLLNFLNSQHLRQDPCKPEPNNQQQDPCPCPCPCPCECPPQEEEEECTITPCCRPFKLQKEHPMKKAKQEKDKCKDEKQGSVKDEKKPGVVNEEKKAGGVKDEKKTGNVKDEKKTGCVKDEKKAGGVKEEKKPVPAKG